jgi:hypothetical protein
VDSQSVNELTTFIIRELCHVSWYISSTMNCSREREKGKRRACMVF